MDATGSPNEESVARRAEQPAQQASASAGRERPKLGLKFRERTA